MAKYKNVMALKFIGEEVYDTLENADLQAWQFTIGANTITEEGLALARRKFPREKQIGSWMYHLIKNGKVEYIDGVDWFDHFIKLPIDWLDEVHHVETSPSVDNDAEEIQYNVLNSQYFKIQHKNETHCLVKIEHNKFAECFDLMQFASVTAYGKSVVNYPLNAICSDKYDEEIETNFKTIIEEEI